MEEKRGPTCFSFAGLPAPAKYLLIVIDVTKPNFLALARFSFFSDLFLNPKLKNVSLLELCLSAQSFLFMRVQLGASPVCQGQGVITLALSVCT